MKQNVWLLSAFEHSRFVTNDLRHCAYKINKTVKRKVFYLQNQPTKQNIPKTQQKSMPLWNRIYKDYSTETTWDHVCTRIKTYTYYITIVTSVNMHDLDLYGKMAYGVCSSNRLTHTIVIKFHCAKTSSSKLRNFWY